MHWFSREEQDGSEARLSRSDRRFLLVSVLAGAAALVLGFVLYPRVNPEASIRFEVSRTEARDRAARFLEEMGLDPAGYRHATRFTWDVEGKVFLERTIGLPGANTVLSDPVRMWRWGQRWYRPLQKEEFRVEVAVDGAIAAFDHPIEELAAGAVLAPDSARGIAERFLARVVAVDPTQLAFEGVVTQQRPARADHTFTWKRPQPDWNGGDLRHEVRVQGDAVGGYRLFVHVPEDWARDYERLRSFNQSAGVVAQALTLLLFIAVLVVLLLRIRMRDIRWRTAIVIGLVGFALQFLAELNALPLLFYDYETTASLGGFLGERMVGSLLSSLLLGMLIFLLTGAGEALYRESYPGKISLSGWFTRRALRTRRFLLSAVLGLALTAFFFCYQQLFYLVAARLGAWAPIEVPYDDLLGTAFPWVFVLLIGFMPAVTEEFLFRMFPIPWLQKGLRSRLLAIVIPALIWGFAHSNYPNQPFYIRGLEVGLAGVLIGAIMLRWNIFATLVWHYTVDALYTGTLLFRSGNPYYVISAAVAGGVILFPLLYAIVSYLRRGRFDAPDGLRNAEAPTPAGTEPAALPPGVPGEDRRAGPDPRAALPAMGVMGVTTTASVEGGGDGGPYSGAYRQDDSGVSSAPWSWRRRTVALAIGGAALLLLLLPGERLETARDITIGREAALTTAASFLREMGVSPESYRRAILPQGVRDQSEARYLRRHGGLDALRARYDGAAPPLRWRARVFRPLEAGEFSIEVDAVSGRIVRFDRTTAERDSLGSLSAAEAESLARRFLAGRGYDLTALERREASEEKRPRRVDHVFRFEASPSDPRNVGEARHRERIEVHGDRIGGWRSELKLPEEWVREQERRTVWNVAAQILPFLAFGAAIGLVLWHLLAAHRARRVPWRAVLLGAIPLGLLGLAGGINAWPGVAMRYVTAVPWELFQVTAGVGILLGLVVNYLLFVLVLAAALAAWPAASEWVRPPRLRRHLPDALLGGLVAVAVLVGLRQIGPFLASRWPGAAPPDLPGFPIGAADAWPWLGMTWSVVRGTVLLAAMGAAFIAVLRAERHRLRALGLLGLLVLAIAVPDAHGAGEFLVRLLVGLVWGGALLALVRLLPAGNLLVWPVAVYLVLAVSAIGEALAPPAAGFRTAAYVAALLLAIPLGWLVRRAWRSGRVRP